MRSTSRCAALILASLARLDAQALATNADGSAVWMTSDWYLQSDAWAANGSFLYRSTGADWDRLFSVTSPGTGFGRLYGPQVTADGRIVGWQRAAACHRCGAVPPTTEFLGLDRPVTIPRAPLFLSRNGRFALHPGWWMVSRFHLEDLETGRVWKAPEAPDLDFFTAWPATVANDGSVAGLLGGHSFVWWRPGSEPRQLVRDQNLPVLWGISAGGRRVWALFATPSRDRQDLVLFDIESGAKTAIPVRSSFFWARISADGRRVLFPSDDGVWLWDEEEGAGGQARRILPATEMPRDAVISDDGRRAWILTGRNSLFEADLDAGLARERLPELPDRVVQLNRGVPGSAMELDASVRGPVEELEFRLGGEPLPVISRTGGGNIVVQVPWEVGRAERFAFDNYPLAVRRPGNPFEYRNVVSLFLHGPWPELPMYDPSRADGVVKASHQDFGSLVTPDNPAKPGETIHLWLLGLGPLDRSVPTGAPGPLDPPARPVAGIACYLMGEKNDPPAVGLRLPFVAYAPGQIGVYQVDATIPSSWPAGLHFIRCESAGNVGGGMLPVR